MTVSTPCVILLVEDNPTDVFLVGEALRASGLPCELRSYSNGDAALEAMLAMDRDESCLLPSLLLLDWNLPTIGGAEVLGALAGMPRLKRMPVAVLTSSASPRDRETAVKLGARRYIQKPLSLQEFLDGVSREMRALVQGAHDAN